MKYRYGLVFRPAAIGCVPKGSFEIEDGLQDAEGRALSRHGIVVFNRPLTVDEMTSFELSVIADDDLREVLADEIAAELGEYAEACVELLREDPAWFRMTVMDCLRKARPYPVYVGLTDRFVMEVQTRLETMR